MAPTTGSPRYEVRDIRMIVLTSTKILQAKTEEGTRGENGERTEERTVGEGEEELMGEREYAGREGCASA
jgi:hypothetical protein